MAGWLVVGSILGAFVTGMSLLVVYIVTSELLRRTQGVWRGARLIWSTFAVALGLVFVGGGASGLALVLMLGPSFGSASTAENIVAGVALVGGSVCLLLGAAALAVWFGLALRGARTAKAVAPRSWRQLATWQQVALALAVVESVVGGGMVIGANLHSWPAGVVGAIALLAITLCLLYMVVRVP